MTTILLRQYLNRRQVYTDAYYGEEQFDTCLVINYYGSYSTARYGGRTTRI